MSELTPRESDLIIGGQNPPPIDAAVLGGLAGVKQRLKSESITVRLQALDNTIQYGKDALDLVIQFLADPAEEIRELASTLLDNLLEETEKNELFRMLANDTDSKPQLLAEISRSKDLTTVKNLANNPNTPPDVLSELGDISNMNAILAANIQEWSKLKQKFNLNPFRYGHVVDFDFNPFGYAHVDLETHYQNLVDLNISIEIVQIVKVACEIYRDATRHPNSPIELLLNLGRWFPTDFICNPILPQLILENPKFIDGNYYTQKVIANHPDTPIEFLQYLLEFGRPGVRIQIAANPSSTIDILEEIMNDVIECGTRPNGASVGIAKNPQTPTYILEKLAIYMEQIIVHPVFFRRDTEKIKHQLGRAIAEHPNTPEELRCKMPHVSTNIFW